MCCDFPLRVCTPEFPHPFTPALIWCHRVLSRGFHYSHPDSVFLCLALVESCFYNQIRKFPFLPCLRVLARPTLHMHPQKSKETAGVKTFYPSCPHTWLAVQPLQNSRWTSFLKSLLLPLPGLHLRDCGFLWSPLWAVVVYFFIVMTILDLEVYVFIF